MKIISGVYWDKGERAQNQDSVILQQVVTGRGRAMLAAVSDGIGGLSEGETASGYITEKLTENFYNSLISLVSRGRGRDAIKKSLLRCLYGICEELKSYGDGKDIKLGATVSLLFVWRQNYVILHLGDSRIYRYRRRRARLLTKDHSDGGRGLTKCMGSFRFQYPDIRFGRLYGKCGFLLCTDGFYRTLEKESFQVLSPREVESEEQIERRLREMAMAAHKRGEQDNMSAVYSVFLN